MAAVKPVLCLDLGGPALQITDKTGVRVMAGDPEQVVSDMAIALSLLASDFELCNKMGDKGQERVRELYDLEIRGKILTQLYQQVEKKRVNSSRNLSAF